MNLNRLFTRAIAASTLLLGTLALPVHVLALTGSTTTLNVSNSTVSQGTAVTLIATSVDGGGTPITRGQVKFCDASATYCEGPALLGIAQMTPAGTASMKIVFGPGSHSIVATFIRGAGYGGDTSASKSITVTGALPTTTTISSSGSAGAYTLTSTMSYHGLLVPNASETVTFNDTSNGNYSLKTVPLSAVSPAVYSFIPGTGSPFNANDIPVAETVGDFNGDGIPDLAVANFTTNTVSVFAGDGHGGFAPLSGSPFAVGNGPTALAVADVNEDGFPDLISVNANASSVSILLGNSSHTLTAGGTFFTGNGPQAIAVADFNHDGHADMAIANLLDSSLTVLLGDGTGNFSNAPAVSAYTSGNPNAIVSDDFNGDGNADIATANLDGTFSVLLGDSTGAFTAMSGSPFATLSYPYAMTVGDFNGDGKPDLAIADSTQNKVAVLLNTGTTFTAPTGSPFAVGQNPVALAANDFNGDGKQDLVVLDADDNNAVILSGDGAGAFVASSQSPVTGLSSPGSLAISDFNGDGTPDLAIGNLSVNKISIRALQISQTATATASGISIPGGGTHLVVASYSGDSSYSSSTSTAVSLIGTKITTSASMFVSPATTVQYLQTLQLTGSVAPANSANYNVSGTGTFADGGTTIASGTIASGSAIASVNALTVGPHSLTFSYPGDANFAGSTTATATSVTVTRANTVTQLTASSSGVTPGAAVTLTAVVAPVTAGTPTGTVNFFSDGVLIGAGTLNAGVATFSVSTLSPASHTLTATYLGDGNYVGSASSGTAVTVTVSDFSITMTPSSQTVIPGRSVNFGLTVTPVNGAYNAPITFSVSGLPNGATATFQPATITPGGSTATTTLTITTRALSASVQRGVSIVAALLLLPFVVTRRARRLLNGRLLAIAVLLIIGAFASGCSGGSGYFDQAAQNYTVTVTATSGTVTHTSTITLNVQ